MNRHLSRTIAMQVLYEWDFRQNSDLPEIIRRSVAMFENDIDREYVIQSVEGVKKRLDEIDGSIIKVAPDWPIEQVALIDKAILRLAIYEILFNLDIPPKVAINEAVELAKHFGSENSSKFVNGVLGTVYRSSSRYQPEEDNVEDDSKERSIDSSNRSKKAS